MIFPCLRAPHMARSTFELNVSSAVAVDTAIVPAVHNLMAQAPPAETSGLDARLESMTLHVREATESLVVVWVFTKRHWFDVAEFHIQPSAGGRQTLVEASSYSTGLFPLSVPLVRTPGIGCGFGCAG